MSGRCSGSNSTSSTGPMTWTFTPETDGTYSFSAESEKDGQKVDSANEGDSIEIITALTPGRAERHRPGRRSGPSGGGSTSLSEVAGGVPGTMQGGSGLWNTTLQQWWSCQNKCPGSSWKRP